MEELKDQESIENNTEVEEEELSHTDKLIGIFTEPSNIFSSISNFPVKAVDWVLPLILFIFVAALSSTLLMNNETIRYSIVEKQMAAMEEQMQEAVESGEMTQAQADQRLEQTRGFMENRGIGAIFQIIGTVFGISIFFFIVCGVFFLVSKFGLKGTGGYSSAMVAYGMPLYIGMLHSIITVIAALALNKFLTGINLADFFDYDKKEFLGFILSKFDPFSIWFYAVLSIGLAKMFKSESTGKYYGMVFGLWIGVSILFFFLSKSLSFLENFN